MNNTTTRTKRNLALVAVFMAATLVVGTFATTTTIATTQTAFAYSQKKDNKKDGSGNGNTITIQKCKQAATQSGWDNNQGQECENLICTHPGENATCVQEGARAAATPIPTPVKNTACEQCFTKFLNPEQRSVLLKIEEVTSLRELCEDVLPFVSAADFQSFLAEQIANESIAAKIIQCLLDAGVQFRSTTT
jgi:hypothetical protein